MTAPDIKPLGQKVRKPKKPPRQNWSEKCDVLFSKLVRRPGVCAIDGCSATTLLQCAHGFSRRYRTVRWDFRNAWCLCSKHHKYYTYYPLQWDDWLRAQWGEVLYAEMRALALSGGTATDTRPALKATYARLKAIEAPK